MTGATRECTGFGTVLDAQYVIIAGKAFRDPVLDASRVGQRTIGPQNRVHFLCVRPSVRCESFNPGSPEKACPKNRHRAENAQKEVQKHSPMCRKSVSKKSTPGRKRSKRAPKQVPACLIKRVHKFNTGQETLRCNTSIAGKQFLKKLRGALPFNQMPSPGKAPRDGAPSSDHCLLVTNPYAQLSIVAELHPFEVGCVVPKQGSRCVHIGNSVINLH